MPRRKRHDHPGCLHHVMNRGLARRSIFEGRGDARRFLSLLTCAVRSGRIELHAYALMLTHFHLLVRSVDGRLSETMRLVQNAYVRSFNRSRRRDGPLMRGRFRSVPVKGLVHARTSFRYIDQNPVDARIVARPADYPFGSARHQRRPARPRRRALSRALVDQLLEMYFPAGVRREDAYDQLFRPTLKPGQKAWIERLLAGPAGVPEDLDHLLASSTPGVHAWALAKARLADGTKPGLPLVDAETVASVVRGALAVHGDWTLRVRGFHRKNGWEVVEAALLHDAAGATYSAIARRLGRSPAHAGKLYQIHATCLRECGAYATRFAELAQACLDRLHGSTKW